MLAILEATQAAYGYLPVAALKRISQQTGAWYAMIYGTATLLRPPAVRAGRRRPTRPPPSTRIGRPRPTYLRRAARPRSAGPARAGREPARGASLTMVDRLKTPAGWPTILLERAGAADPTDLDAAVRAGAFDGLRAAVRDLGPTATIATIAASGSARPRRRRLPGRRQVADGRGAPRPPRRYVVANGYGADPAPATDRFLLERDPYAVIEGAAIAAFAIGATRGDHRGPGRGRPRPSARLEAAIGAAEEAGFIGFDVLRVRDAT